MSAYPSAPLILKPGRLSLFEMTVQIMLKGAVTKFGSHEVYGNRSSESIGIWSVLPFSNTIFKHVLGTWMEYLWHIITRQKFLDSNTLTWKR